MGADLTPDLHSLLQTHKDRFTTATAAHWGIPHATLHRAVKRGILTRPMRGFYVRTDVWREAFPEQRHQWLVEALAQRSPHLIFAYESAAAVYGIPRLDKWHSRPQVISGCRTKRGTHRASVKTFHEPLVAESLQVRGMRVTDPATTIVDLARRDSMWSAVASADHAVRHKMTDVDAINERIRSMSGRTGIARARTYLTHIDGRAESVGESWSRILLLLHGFEIPDLQQSFHDEDGFVARCDFHWEDAGIIGEFDGLKKYVDPATLNGRDPRKVLAEEKMREDRLRQLGLQTVRWIWADLKDPTRLIRRLKKAGVPRSR